MLRNNKWKLIISSLLILLPILAGSILWDSLPEQMAIHWGTSGNANGWSSRGFAVFLLPIFLLVFHWVCLLITAMDHKSKTQNPKVYGIVFWIVPFISLFANGIMYATAFGKTLNLPFYLSVLMGLMFVVIGNYMPKATQNRTMGIKTVWALHSEENWNMTHRFAGKVWVIGGVLFMTAGLLPLRFFPFALLVPILFGASPALYSYLYYRKQKKNGTLIETDTAAFVKEKKMHIFVSVIITVSVVLLFGFIAFTGDVSLEYGEDAFTVRATYFDDATIAYDDIESIEYRENDMPGMRTFGYASPRLLMGAFQNDEFGNYTRYSYTACDDAVILTVNGKKIVINAKTEVETKLIYDTLTEKRYTHK